MFYFSITNSTNVHMRLATLVQRNPHRPPTGPLTSGAAFPYNMHAHAYEQEVCHAVLCCAVLRCAVLCCAVVRVEHGQGGGYVGGFLSYSLISFFSGP